MDQITLSLYAAAVIFAAGVVKGSIGFGLPTTSLALLTLMVDARTAIALVLFPMFVSNLWQLWRAGEMARAAVQYAPYILCLCIGILVTFFVTADADDTVLLAVLGIAILLYVAIDLTGWRPAIPARKDRAAQGIAGSLSGIMGGIVSVWAPPMVLYLAARQVPKDEFVRASGLILCVGSVPLLFAYTRAGFLTWPLMTFSVALLVPTFLGFAVGERLRGRLSDTGFRRALMIMFAVMGLNLLRRAVI